MSAGSSETPQRDTFCVLAWNHLQIAPNGTVKMCCIAGEDISDGTRTMSLYSDTYEQIWNSRYMRDARRGMAEGEEISACTRCYREEDAVGQSRRTTMNAAWAAGHDRQPERLTEAARAQDWRVADRPEFLQLNLGNLCNLACRMCSSQYSSKIEHDPVHNQWMPAAYPDVARWRGERLSFGPRPRFGVRFRGFHEYEAGDGYALRWSDGLGRIDFPLPANAEIRALGVSLRPVGGPTRVVVRLNGIELTQTEISSEWTQRFELAGLGNQSELELEIESDAVEIGHRRLGVGLLDAWIERTAAAGQTLSNARTLTRFAQDEPWWAQPEVLLQEIFSQPEKLRYLILQGGEPFLVKEFEDILHVLIESGAASEVTFEIVSNMTILRDWTLEKMARLKHVSLGASIDGIGPTLEYIRYPAKWSEIVDNLRRASRLPNVQISFNTAVQLYNLLDVTNILRYCDSNGWDAHMHFLVGPRYLNALVLPRAAREEAMQRITSYLAGSGRPNNRTTAEYVLSFLNSHHDQHYREEFPNLVRFTNDMDVSRGQSFAALYPDLLDWFAEDGLVWTSETRFAVANGNDTAAAEDAASAEVAPPEATSRPFWRRMLRPRRLLAMTRN